MFEIFVAGPDLSLMDRLDALREGFQGMTAIENTSRTVTKSVNHSLGFLTSQTAFNLALEFLSGQRE
jgi:hypothetical protein